MSDEEDVDEAKIDFASPIIGQTETSRVIDALESGWLTTGPKTQELEEAIASEVGATCALGTINCTAALYLAIRALGIEGEVITTPFTFATTVSSCRLAGATPVLADVRRDTLTLDPEAVKETITPDTEAVMLVHYAGQGTDLDAFRELATDHDLALIEDAAHALGGYFEGEALGTLGDAGCYSFYATKTITTGEGGMLVTDDVRIDETARRLRLAGIDKDSWARETSGVAGWTYDVTNVSMKFNMNDIQGSLGLAQLDRLTEFLRKRRRLADRYDELLSSVDGVEPLAVRDSSEHARHIYPIFVDEEETGISRTDLIAELDDTNIGTGVHYIPIHYHSAFEDIETTGLPVAEERFEQVVSLPLHPNMDENDVLSVVEAVGRIVDY